MNECVNATIPQIRISGAVAIYGCVVQAILVITAMYFPLMIYLVLFKSSKLGEYKYFILANVISSFAFESSLGLCQPVFLFPYLAGYAQGVIRPTNDIVAFIFLFFIFYSAACVIIGNFYALLFRYRIIAPDRIREIMEIKWVYQGTLIYGYVGMACVMAFSLFWMRPDPEKKESYIKMHPEFCQISKAEPTLIIFNDNEFSASNFFLLGYPIIAFIILGTFATIFHLEYQLYSQKSKLSPTTFRLQKMMNTAFKAELFSAHIFLLAPITIAILVVHTKNKDSSAICHVALMFGSLYCIFLYSSMIYFIKPYRTWLSEFLFVGSRVVTLQSSVLSS